MKDISFSKSKFVSVCAVYLCIPVLLFFCFYLNIVAAIICSASIIAVCGLFIRNSLKEKELTELIKISPIKLVGIVIFALLLCFVAGIGEFIWSSYDHLVRWATLNDMVHYKWPIIYDLSTQENPAVREYLGDGTAAFSYYLTFWVVPALIGKIGGLYVARISLLIWSAIGMTLVILGLLTINKNRFAVVIGGFLFFGGLDFIPYLIQDKMGLEVTNPEGWNSMFIVNGTFDQMMNVFNQCIPAWIIVIIFLLIKDNKSIGFIGALMFPYSPWATIGLFPIALYMFINNSKDKKKIYKDIIHINNWLFPVIALVVFGSFYTMNSSAVSLSGFAWETTPDIKLLVLKYLGYIVVEFGVWYLIIYPRYKKDKLYWVLLAELLIFPIYQITEFNDLLMRGSITPIFIITIWVINVMDETITDFLKERKSKIKLMVISLAFFVGMMTQFLLLVTCITSTYTTPEMSESRRHDINSFGNINNDHFAYMADYQFLIRDYESTFFFKYLAAKR